MGSWSEIEEGRSKVGKREAWVVRKDWQESRSDDLTEMSRSRVVNVT